MAETKKEANAAFDFFVEPRLECYVTHETEPVPCVKVVSKSCELFGSPFVQSLNQCFDIHVEGRITWPPPDEGTNGACQPISRTCYQNVILSLNYRVYVVFYHSIWYQTTSGKILHMCAFINAKAPTMRVNAKARVIKHLHLRYIIA